MPKLTDCAAYPDGTACCSNASLELTGPCAALQAYINVRQHEVGGARGPQQGNREGEGAAKEEKG